MKLYAIWKYLYCILTLGKHYEVQMYDVAMIQLSVINLDGVNARINKIP